MKALCWEGVNRVSAQDVADPSIMNDQDALVRVTASSVCGSDLHLLDGYIPAMREGDIIGHEFMGEVVDTGRAVQNLAVGDRVVVGSIIGCGECWYCVHDEWSLCDNSNPLPGAEEQLWGYAGAGIFGYSHLTGGYAGSHAEYVRVPFADRGSFRVPEGVRDEQALFASDAVPTGWMAADMCGIEPGDTVAVWGAGGVGLMAMHAAYLLGAERVIAIDRLPYRLETARRRAGAEPLNYEHVDVTDALRDMTGGRGPDRCIEAVGMEARSTGLYDLYDRAKQLARLETDRAPALRQAIVSCRKGGTVSIVGVYGGFVDKFPMGAAMNKALTLRMGQQHSQRYVPMLLERIERGELDPSYLLTHPMTLEQGQFGYEMFKHKADHCLRTVFFPQRA